MTDLELKTAILRVLIKRKRRGSTYLELSQYLDHLKTVWRKDVPITNFLIMKQRRLHKLFY